MFLSHPSEGWKGAKRHVNADVIRENCFAPDGEKESVTFLCGPPAMVQMAALPALRVWET
jgi:nitrate reductase (NAD(P)H)